ncbi:MAG: hypothetical protein HC780_24350 [Leptolyngbyaceae cyanobacterium CSU_1_3]|nr:hypothetical protein [Leptolyngbyaceae cyanobacterium CSU_1_3]
MTNSPEPGNLRPNPRRRRSRFTRIGIPLGLASAVGIGAGVWYGNRFVETELGPLVQTNLTQLLNRPVELGKVERFSLTGLRFGQSRIPETLTDRDRATVEAVEVGFDPIQLILSRTLKLDVTLVKPTVYIEQDKSGVWVSTSIQEQEAKGLIKTQLEILRLEDAQVELSPFPKRGRARSSIRLTDVVGEVTPVERNRQFDYEAAGRSSRGGDFSLKGRSLNQQGLDSNIDIRGQNFLAEEIDRLVKLPVDLTRGRINGNVNVRLRPDEPPLVKGTADFKDVTLGIPQLPQTFTNSTGKLQLKETLITLEDVTTSLGRIPLVAKGTIDTQRGFNLSAQVKAVTLDNFLKTFAIRSPFAVMGEVRADVKVTGAIDQPILSGTTQNTKLTQVDRLTLSKASADFRLDTRSLNLAISNLRATPTVGGEVTGQGRLSLAEPRTIALSLNARNVSGDLVARLYNNGQSPPIAIGRVNSQVQVTGAIDNVQTVARFQALEADYPTIGEVTIVGGNAVFRNVVAQVAGGTVNAEARTIGANWQATVQAAGIRATQFVPQLTGVASGNFNLSGTTDSFALENIRATGKARLTEGVGIVNADLDASGGRFQALVRGNGLQLSRFSPDLRGLLSGDLRVTGLVDSLRPSSLRADGQVRLSEGISLIEEPIVAQVQWDGRKLNIPQATAPGFSANGAILARLEGAGAPAIAGLDLSIRTTNFALAKLPIPRPPVTDLTGQVDLVGRITGTPASPNVTGDVTVKGLSLNGITFDSRLVGGIQLVPTQGFSINVAGSRDRINLALDPNYRPISLYVKRDEAIVRGITQGDIFRVNVQQLPLEGLMIPGVQLARFGSFGGRLLTGNLNIDVNRLQVVDGALTVIKPPRIRPDGSRDIAEAETIRSRFVNTGNIIRFTDTFVEKGTSRYTLAGSLDLRSRPKFEGKVAIAQGKIEDILKTLQVSQISDFAQILQPPTANNAAAVQTVAVGLPDARLLDQLRRFAEINNLLRQVASDRRKLTIPELADIRGTFDGSISLSAGLGSPVKAEFDLTAQNVEWRPYPSFAEVEQGRITQNSNRVIEFDRIIAKGSFENGVVNLLPLRLEADDSLINVSGNFGGANQAGQLQVTNLPIERIEVFYPLPIGITGKSTRSPPFQEPRATPLQLVKLISPTPPSTGHPSSLRSATSTTPTLDSALTPPSRSPHPNRSASLAAFRLSYRLPPLFLTAIKLA